MNQPLFFLACFAAISIGLSLTVKYYGPSSKAVDAPKPLQTSETPATPEELSHPAITKIACGSCFKPNYVGANEIWETIAATEPQIFLFMGDNIYADTEDMNLMRKKYQALKNLPAYAKFSQEHEILPIWDDHDYGKNDAGAEYPKKVESQKNFMDAYDFPADHPTRSREGIYYSVRQGPEGKVTQIINLDTRYHRSKLDRRKIGKKYHYFPVTDPDATMLGAAQWEWLEQQLQKPADLRIIVSSIQIISDQHRYEKWSNIPAERQRFLDLLKKTDTQRVLLLSGDRHLAEVSKLTPKDSGLDYDLLEMTSSGLTHSGIPKNADNPYNLIGSFANVINFGTLDIDWSNPIPEVTLSTLGKKGDLIYQTKTEFKK